MIVQARWQANRLAVLVAEPADLWQTQSIRKFLWGWDESNGDTETGVWDQGHPPGEPECRHFRRGQDIRAMSWYARLKYD